MNIPLICRFSGKALIFACLGAIACATPLSAQGALFEYSTIFTVGDLDNPSNKVDPSQLVSGDKFEVRFILNHNAEASSEMFYNDLFAGISFTPLPGNTGNYPTGSYTLTINSYAEVWGGGGLALNFMLNVAETPQVDLIFGVNETTGGLYFFSLNFSDYDTPFISTGDRFSSVANVLLEGSRDAGISMLSYQADNNGGFLSYYGANFTELTITPVPEPGTFALVGAAGAALVLLKRRRRK